MRFISPETKHSSLRQSLSSIRRVSNLPNCKKNTKYQRDDISFLPPSAIVRSSCRGCYKTSSLAAWRIRIQKFPSDLRLARSTEGKVGQSKSSWKIRNGSFGRPRTSSKKSWHLRSVGTRTTQPSLLPRF